MRALVKGLSFPLITVFLAVVVLVNPLSVSTARAGNFFDGQSWGKILGTIAGGALGVALLSTLMPSFGMIGMAGGALLGAVLGNYLSRLLTGESDFESVTDCVRDTWHHIEDKGHDVGWWFIDRYDNVRDYFDEKFGKPQRALAPIDSASSADLGELRQEFVKASKDLREAMSSGNRKEQRSARERYDKAYSAYFSARGSIGK